VLCCAPEVGRPPQRVLPSRGGRFRSGLRRKKEGKEGKEASSTRDTQGQGGEGVHHEHRCCSKEAERHSKKEEDSV
jgi:hypothetical protein